MSYLSCVEIEPETVANCTVIWLHGLGADGRDFAPLVPQLTLPDELAPRFVFPNAPSIPVTVNGGISMPAWYDIYEFSLDRKVDAQGLDRSTAATLALINREIERGIDSRRILLAGFSQGGAVVYQAALGCDQPLAGLLVLSSYLANPAGTDRNPANAQLPIMIQHGTLDSVVPEVLGRRAAEQLRAWGYAPEYQTYPSDHGLCPEQIPVIQQWLAQCLGGR